MKPQFINRLAPSFLYFLDHQILTMGIAYTNKNGGALYPSSDPNYPSQKIWASPYRQFVSDSSIAGANIPSGIYLDGVFIPRGTSGLSIDFDMGRVMADSNFPEGTVTCDYAYKDYNVYYTEAQDEKLIFESNYPARPNVGGSGYNTPLPYDTIPYPAIFIKLQYNKNKPFAYGGLDEVSTEFRCVVIADSPYLLDAAVSISADCNDLPLPMLLPADMPFNEYGDYKNDKIYDYIGLCTQYQPTGSLMTFCDDVKISKVQPFINQLIGNNSYCAFADFSIVTYRSPRAI